MPAETTSCHDVPATSSSCSQGKAGECRWEYILGEGFGLRFDSAKLSSTLVAGTDQGECRSDYMVERLREQEDGGSSPPPDNRVAQQRMSGHTSALNRLEAANAGGTTWDFSVAGSNPAGRKPVAQLDRA